MFCICCFSDIESTEWLNTTYLTPVIKDMEMRLKSANTFNFTFCQCKSLHVEFVYFWNLPLPLQDVTSWREGGGRNLQPSSLTLGLPADAEGKNTALGETGTPPASSHPSSTTGTTSCSIVTVQSPVLDTKEPSLRPAQPIRRTTVPTALQYQLHHTSTAVYHDMLPAFVSTIWLHWAIVCKLLWSKCTDFKMSSAFGGSLYFYYELPSCFQMCSKETREAPGTDHGSTTIAAPARFDSKPAFRQSYAKQELVKLVHWQCESIYTLSSLWHLAIANLCFYHLWLQWWCEKRESLCSCSPSTLLSAHPQAWWQDATPNHH